MTDTNDLDEKVDRQAWTDQEERLKSYMEHFKDLDMGQPQKILDLLAEDFIFEDPFNSVVGKAAFLKVLEKTREDVERPLIEPRYWVWQDIGKVAVLKWRFTGTIKGVGALDFEGFSEVGFNEEGFISSHRDFWDSGQYFWMKVPVIGWLMAWVLRRFRVS